MKRRDCKLSNLFPEIQEAIEELVNMLGLELASEKLREILQEARKCLLAGEGELMRIAEKNA